MKVVSLEAVSGIKPLVDIALKGLASTYDAASGLFNAHLGLQGVVNGNGLTANRAVENRATLISLLGLNEAFQYDLNVPLDVEGITLDLIERMTSFTSLGDLGLLIWLTARTHPEALPLLYDRIDWPYSLDQFPDARSGKTLELCWLLAGLSEIRLSDGEEPDQLDELAHMTRQIIFVNYGGFGAFRHLAKGGLKQLGKARYGSFADQAFAIYAFSRYARAYADDQALAIAKACGRCIVECQGALGQWWWLYDVDKGSAVRKYPVHSVHQDGLAPMALNALTEVSGDDFVEPVQLGLQWIRGNNELGIDLFQPDHTAIWDRVQDSRYPVDAEELNSITALLPIKKGKRTLHLTWECSPRHLGWLLYALAGYAE